MEHLEINKLLNTIRRYVKIYGMLVRYAAQIDFMYWGNLLVSILVELFYQGAFFAFFAVIMSKTSTIAGWGPNQMIILLGIDTLTSELLTGMLIVWNTREIPLKIWSGELDRILLRPIHPLFNLTLGRPYFPSFISTIVGVILIIIGTVRIGFIPSIMGVLGTIIFFILGYLIVYCIIVNFSLLTFFFQDTSTLPRIGERIVYSFTSRPHTIYSGIIKFIFFFIFPVVYVSSFSANTFIFGVDYKWLSIVFIITIFSLLITFFIWKKAIRNYSSASS
jgi:ABC-2 type transport system permease protein